MTKKATPRIRAYLITKKMTVNTQEKILLKIKAESQSARINIIAFKANLQLSEGVGR